MADFSSTTRRAGRLLSSPPAVETWWLW